MFEAWAVVCSSIILLVLCVCVQVLLSSPVCVPDGLWLEEKEGANGERRLLGAGVSALCLHRDRKL